MKKIKLFFIGVFLLPSMMFFAQTLEVASIADAKKQPSYTNMVFSSELTLQYVSNVANVVNFYATDSNNEFVRLSSYYWSNLENDNKLKVGDKIKVASEMQFVNDENSCATFNLELSAVNSISIIGVGEIVKSKVVTIDELKRDINREFNASFVSIEGAKVESLVDFNISPFPINKIVVEDNSIDFVMGEIMTDYPAKANVLGFVDYQNNLPKLYIPQFDGFVDPVIFDNISSMKLFKSEKPYEDVNFESKVLVTDVKNNGTEYIYRVQQDDILQMPSAMQIVIPQSFNFVCQVGDSVLFNVQGKYIAAQYREKPGIIDEMSTARFIVEVDNASRVVSSGNMVQSISLNILFENNEAGWMKYDNCLVTTEKCRVFESEILSSVGCHALIWPNEITNRNDTLLIPKTYYVEIGSPKEVIVCGFIGGYEYAGKSYAAIIPRSKGDFLSELMEFESIAAMKAVGPTPSRSISYRITSPMAITGFTSVTDMGTVYMIFLQDETGSLQINHESLDLQKKYKIGDVVTGITGYYSVPRSRTYYSENYGYVFASAPLMEIDVESVLKSDESYVATPIEITLAQLDDSYASHLVKITDVNYRMESVVLSTEEKYLPLVYQGNDWAILSDKYKYVEDMTSITGVYFLYSKLTQIIPRSQEDVVYDGSASVAVENVEYDNNLFVENGYVSAEGATIVVYDIVGRRIADGEDRVDISHLKQEVVLVQTIYGNNSIVTKLVKL